MSKQPVIVHWFRRDLRLQDNRGFAEALKLASERTGETSVMPLFIFDTEILTRLEDKNDARVTFIHDTVSQLKEELRQLGSDVNCLVGKPLVVWEKLLAGGSVKAITVNEDYEPGAIARDLAIEKLALKFDVPFLRFKDQVVFEKNEVTKDDGKPYTVFTPYAKKWKATLEKWQAEDRDPLASPRYRLDSETLSKFSAEIPELKKLGFVRNAEIEIPSVRTSEKTVRDYAKWRDLPAVQGTSRLGLHLRFGTVSIRRLVKKALQLGADVWLNELIWREFFMQILWHFPHVAEHAFRPEYDQISWRHSESDFQAWCEGKTGYPLVDAGMRELNATGFMHNRVRMVTASFLVKHLLIDWRWGEEYFARKLLDFDLAANNGNWQWVAGSGCDAAPYFRIFNPALQAKRFDPKNEYIRKWVPEFGTSKQPSPIVDHGEARARVLRAYAVVKERPSD